MLGMPEDQKKQMRYTMLMSPVMILFFTMSSPAGLGLYFFVGGLFACLQTLIINFYRPRIRRQIKEEMEKMPKPAPVAPVKPVAPKQVKAQQKQIHHNNRNRNAGKQQHRR